MSILRVLTRYWLVVLLILLVVGLQLGLGFVVVKSAGIGFKMAKQEQQAPSPTAPVAVVSTSIPTNTPVPPTPTPSSTMTTSPTRTPTPTSTTTGTPTPTDTPLPSPAPTSTFTPTPGPTPIAAEITIEVPILMYHYLSIPPADADVYRQDLSVTPAQFESHLAYLRQEGYETITLRQLAYTLSGHLDLPAKPIIVTFDDGYRDNYENAFPLLRKYGYTGVFFIFTYPIDAGNPDYLSWDMVAEMHQAGMEIGSHGYRHWDLRGRDVDFLVYEMVGSKEAIEAHIGEPVRFFSYPAGRYDDLAIRVLDSAYFWSAVTTEWGIEQSFSNRFEMPRLRIRGSDTVADLAEKLNSF